MWTAGGAMQTLDGPHRLAVDLPQERDAGIHRLATAVGAFQHDGAGAAIALGAALLGAPEAAMLAQPVEQRRHRRQAVELHRLVVEDKTNAVRHANDCDRGVLYAQARLAMPSACCLARGGMMHFGCHSKSAKKWIPTGSLIHPSSSDRSFPGPTARGSRCGSARISSTTSISLPRCGCAIPGRACRIPTCWVTADATTATASACGACSRSWTSTACAAPCLCRCR